MKGYQYYSTHAESRKGGKQFKSLLKDPPADSAWIIQGGRDIHPMLYGEEITFSFIQEEWLEQDFREAELVERLMELEIPLVGICRGHQMINVIAGGNLCQDIYMDLEYEPIVGFHNHRTIQALRDSHLARCFPDKVPTNDGCFFNIPANTLHHQAVWEVPEGWNPTAWSPDGVIESIEDPNQPWIITAQWHPEMLGQLHNILHYLSQWTR